MRNLALISFLLLFYLSDRCESQNGAPALIAGYHTSLGGTPVEFEMLARAGTDVKDSRSGLVSKAFEGWRTRTLIVTMRDDAITMAGPKRSSITCWQKRWFGSSHEIDWPWSGDMSYLPSSGKLLVAWCKGQVFTVDVVTLPELNVTGGATNFPSTVAEHNLVLGKVIDQKRPDEGDHAWMWITKLRLECQSDGFDVYLTDTEGSKQEWHFAWKASQWTLIQADPSPMDEANAESKLREAANKKFWDSERAKKSEVEAATWLFQRPKPGSRVMGEGLNVSKIIRKVSQSQDVNAEQSMGADSGKYALAVKYTFDSWSSTNGWNDQIVWSEYVSGVNIDYRYEVLDAVYDDKQQVLVTVYWQGPFLRANVVRRGDGAASKGLVGEATVLPMSAREYITPVQ